MPLSVVAPVALFAVMGTAFVAAVWRIVVVGGEARRSAQSLRVASDAAHRAEILISGLAASLDGLRNRHLEPEPAAAVIATGRAALAALTGDVSSAMTRTAGGSVAGGSVAGLLAEMERAARAIDLIDHGRELMVEASGSPGEGETAVKRGYLNLLHARDAIRDCGDEIRAASAPASAVRAERHV